MRYPIVASCVLLAACGDSDPAETAGETIGDDGSGVEVSVSTGPSVPEDLYIECDIPFEHDPESAEIRSFIAYEGELRNFSSFDERVQDNCEPQRDGCRDTFEEGRIVSERTSFATEDETVRVVTIDLDTLETSEVKRLPGGDEPTEIAVTCQRLPYPETVSPPSPF